MGNHMYNGGLSLPPHNSISRRGALSQQEKANSWHGCSQRKGSQMQVQFLSFLSSWNLSIVVLSV